MLRKFIISAAATGALLVTVAIPKASAETDIQVNFNLGGYPNYYPESYPVYPSYPVTDENDDYDCGDCGNDYITVIKWNRYRLVHKRVLVCN